MEKRPLRYRMPVLQTHPPLRRLSAALSRMRGKRRRGTCRGLIKRSSRKHRRMRRKGVNMYYLYDLYKNTYKKFADARELICYLPKRHYNKNEWNVRAPYYWEVDTDLLNVTGKDTFETIASASPLTYRYSLRPYLIFDEYGRHVDIRNWDLKDPYFDWTPPIKHHRYRNNGAKRNRRKWYSPAFRHRAYQMRCDRAFEEVEAETRAREKTRHVKSLDLSWEVAERKENARYHERSWKRKKCAAQWAKHSDVTAREVREYRREKRSMCDDADDEEEIS